MTAAAGPGRPLALSMGEPAGIGLDLALKLWTERGRRRLPAFVALGDPAAYADRAALLGLDVPIAEVAPDAAAAVFGERFPVTPVGGRCVGAPGRPDPRDAETVIGAIRLGVELVHGERCAALVTAPIAKAPLMQAGFPHPGHTEYLGALATELWGAPARAVMLLWAEEVAVVPVTVHVPLSAVPGLLTEDDIVETGRILARDLRRRFRIPSPRIAVAGLNPHAGEDGRLGHEDEAIVAPAVRRLRDDGIAATGPHPADTLFHAAARARYDAALCMYHDQALIPVKTLAFDRAVNVTLGLPFVRTSPDHGTAFDISGTGTGSPESLAAALDLATRLSGEPALP
ncbi:4-hydroxythreonine-4-phosphate dehydrogenase 2 [Methylopila jiangsuensis]|uniref:4-hydroxythreonine-4-phosphate dehydrogenase n=1 Tax=Methylopila jiangsuensis TaxID=586230 RepID=A0A9W6JJB3_9HYPH|nr:4-hydroxythreonine-4-phosphate dehydrogenase PdxA [Methylopila jiangsuensis]MDR6286546.1 4-hydroxythreonine-4-phosphate dehydrogenase [Methylopila jiangsuensis]GLK77114.1 4-hydroxythreonine-4-phosphate dehydrogenase 2 [Methylopila jiangsuensis]